jgi:hypothetical protein
MTPRDQRTKPLVGRVHSQGGRLFQRRGMVIRDLGPDPYLCDSTAGTHLLHSDDQSYLLLDDLLHLKSGATFAHHTIEPDRPRPGSDPVEG